MSVLIRVEPEVLDMWCSDMTRVENGALVTVTWELGEQLPDGTYEPMFIQHTKPLDELDVPYIKSAS